MTKQIDFTRCSLDQLKKLCRFGKTDKIANEAWSNYKKSGSNDWGYFAQFGKTDKIANEAWSNYKKSGGNDWEYFAQLGKTDEIKSEAKSMFYDISEFINK